MTVYLIHFDRHYRHAGHYLGCTDNLQARLESHQSGTGARLMQVIREEAIPWQFVRIWEGDFALEHQLKRCKNGPRLCPICRAVGGKR